MLSKDEIEQIQKRNATENCTPVICGKADKADKADKAVVINEELVTPEYLIARGFVQYWGNPDEEELPLDFPYKGYGYHHYIEKQLHRQMFVVVFDSDEGSTYTEVHVQEDVGCGFVQIPFPWSELSVEFFEAVYYGIRGHKPKLV